MNKKLYVFLLIKINFTKFKRSKKIIKKYDSDKNFCFNSNELVCNSNLEFLDNLTIIKSILNDSTAESYRNHINSCSY